MDEVLLNKLSALQSGSTQGQPNQDVSIEYSDTEGAIEIGEGDDKQTYFLKPLAELYGAGVGIAFSLREKAFLPLAMCIEEQIVLIDSQQSPLTDASVLLTLQSLSMNPEQPSADALGRRIQISLRLLLSLNNYSRQEVRQAIRGIAKSVQRHQSGSRGYLDFIRAFFAKGMKG